MVVYEPGWQSNFFWSIPVGFVLVFFVAFGMGANDCANSYGTVVGAGVLKLRQAYLLATIFEILGACLLGYKVTDTMRKQIVNVEIYDINIVKVQQNESDQFLYLPQTDPSLLSLGKNICLSSMPNMTDDLAFNCTKYTEAGFIIGEIGALIGTAVWLLTATLFMQPVSTTHSAVGSTVGFSLVLKGPNGINWMTIIKIVISWIVSPLVTGIMAIFFYIVVKSTVLMKPDPFRASIRMLPWFSFFTLTVNIFAVIYDGSKYLHFHDLSWWVVLIFSVCLGTLAAAFMKLWGNDWVRRRVIRISSSKSSKSGGSLSPYSQRIFDEIKALKTPIEEHPLAAKVFNYLQLTSACFLSFGHGSNDTANAVGPLVALWLTYHKGHALDPSGETDFTVQCLIGFAAVCMIIGLWVLGHKVIQTMGTTITTITSPSGFAMELSIVFTVLVCSKLGLPISTTHCTVGAVVCVGWFKSREGSLSWRTFRNIALAWIVTLPASGLTAALVTYLMTFLL